MAVRMTDITDKKATVRTATASVRLIASPGSIRKIKNGTLPKGDCLSAAQAAGILAAKNTALILPLCHPLALTHADIAFQFAAATLTITCVVKAHDATGAEMEALTACAVAALTVYDMAKTEQKDIVITDLKLLKKTGGKSGDYIRKSG